MHFQLWVSFSCVQFFLSSLGRNRIHTEKPQRKPPSPSPGHSASLTSLTLHLCCSLNVPKHFPASGPLHGQLPPPRMPPHPTSTLAVPLLLRGILSAAPLKRFSLTLISKIQSLTHFFLQSTDHYLIFYIKCINIPYPRYRYISAFH